MNLPPDASYDQNFVNLINYRLRYDGHRKIAFYMQVIEDHLRHMTDHYVHEKGARFDHCNRAA